MTRAAIGGAACRPLGPREETLWRLDCAVPGTGVNTLPAAWAVGGRLDHGALLRALGELSAQWPALRTVIRNDRAEPVLTLLAAPEVDLTVARCTDRDLTAQLEAFAAAPVNLNGPSPVRWALWSADAGDVLALAAHHLVFDARSAGSILAGLAPIYDAAVAGQPAPLVTQPDGPAGARDPDADLAYWRQVLSGIEPGGPRLSSAKPRTGTLRTERVDAPLSPQAVAAVTGLGRRLRAPEAVVLAGACVLALASGGAGPDTLVGMPVDLRSSESRHAPGNLTALLPLRVDVRQGDGVASVIRSVRAAFFDGLRHAATSADPLVGLPRHLVDYLPMRADPPMLGGAVLEPLAVTSGFSPFELELRTDRHRGGIGLRAVYQADVLARADAAELLSAVDAALVTG